MRVLVCGSTGCIGSAVVHGLRSRGHQVVEGARGLADGRSTLQLDFMQPITPQAWAERLAALHLDAIVNCVGILMPAAGQSFERVHAAGPAELFRGAARAGVSRIVQVSALGVREDTEALATTYLRTKLLADDVLASLPLEWAVLRPSLVYGPRSQSATLFATLSGLPLIGLPGRGDQSVQPLHVNDLAEAVANLVEGRSKLRRIYELGGAEPMSYRDMLAHYRVALGLGEALWLPMPMPLMKLGARLAEALPQTVLSRDTMRLLERGNVPSHNDLPLLLRRAPLPMSRWLAITPPRALVDLRAELSPVLELALRASLAFMWIYTSLISAWLPHESGVMRLLARCGFEGAAGVAALVASCTLNLTLGALLLLRPSVRLHALQAAAVMGYTTTAALNMPELTFDHCGPLVKNLPVLACVLLLWIATPPRALSPHRTLATTGTRPASSRVTIAARRSSA
jgi:nucleoside-diphosphate-sugar epimerase